MLHLLSTTIHSPADWTIMQRAHAKASVLLNRCPYSHIDANRIARTVMRLFDDGLRDENMIAAKAANLQYAA